tara:strand:+ start:6407 stop:6685 length:279 start_codon:yes stop_codon:yes gene_type:complete
MNGRKSKKVRLKAKLLFIEWIGSFLKEEDRKQINLQNFTQLLPDETHVYANRRLMHSAFSFRWFIKYVKILSKNKAIDDIKLTDVMEYARVS